MVCSVGSDFGLVAKYLDKADQATVAIGRLLWLEAKSIRPNCQDTRTLVRKCDMLVVRSWHMEQTSLIIAQQNKCGLVSPKI